MFGKDLETRTANSDGTGYPYPEEELSEETVIAERGKDDPPSDYGDAHQNRGPRWQLGA